MKTSRATASAGVSDYGDVSSIIINQLHRMVRHGFRPVSKPSKLPAHGGGGKTFYSAASGERPADPFPRINATAPAAMAAERACGTMQRRAATEAPRSCQGSPAGPPVAWQ